MSISITTVRHPFLPFQTLQCCGCWHLDPSGSHRTLRLSAWYPVPCSCNEWSGEHTYQGLARWQDMEVCRGEGLYVGHWHDCSSWKWSEQAPSGLEQRLIKQATSDIEFRRIAIIHEGLRVEGMKIVELNRGPTPSARRSSPYVGCGHICRHTPWTWYTTKLGTKDIPPAWYSNQSVQWGRHTSTKQGGFVSLSQVTWRPLNLHLPPSLNRCWFLSFHQAISSPSTSQNSPSPLIKIAL